MVDGVSRKIQWEIRIRRGIRNRQNKKRRKVCHCSDVSIECDNGSILNKQCRKASKDLTMDQGNKRCSDVTIRTTKRQRNNDSTKGKEQKTIAHSLSTKIVANIFCCLPPLSVQKLLPASVVVC